MHERKNHSRHPPRRDYQRGAGSLQSQRFSWHEHTGHRPRGKNQHWTHLLYFPQQEDILLACCEEVAALHLEFFTQASDIADPLKRFDFVVRELYISLDRGSKQLIIMYRDSSTLPHETRQRILALMKNLDNRFLELFKEGQRAGVFRQDIPDPRVLAVNVVGLGHMWALHKTWRFEPEIDLETYISSQLAYFHAQLLDNTKDNE